MKNKLTIVLSLIMAVTMLSVMAVPALASYAPLGANSNTLDLYITRPATTYQVGDIIHYTVTVAVPLTIQGGVPCWQENNITTFVDPAGNTQNFPPIDSLLPGESVSFTSTGATYNEYTPVGSDPTRAQLEGGTHAMPANPTYVPNYVRYHGSYPLLDYTVDVADIVYEDDVYKLTASAVVFNDNGAHSSETNDDAYNSKNLSDSIEAGTELHITAADSPIAQGTGTTLTVTEENTGGVPLENPYIVVLMNGGAFATLTKTGPNPTGTVFDGDANGNDVLDMGETWSWSDIPTGNLNANATFQATGHGTAPGSTDITYSTGYTDERKSVTVNVDSPSTIANISADPTYIPDVSGYVELTVTEYNDGAVDLENIVMTVTNNVNSTTYTLTKDSPFYVSGDIGGDAILSAGDPGETWTWSIPGVLVTESTTFTVYGDGTYGQPPIHVNFDTGDHDEVDTVRVSLEPPREAPGSNAWSIGLLIAGFAGAIVLFGYRKSLRFRS